METEPARLSTYSQVAADLTQTIFAILVVLCNQGRALSDTMDVQPRGG